MDDPNSLREAELIDATYALDEHSMPAVWWKFSVGGVETIIYTSLRDPERIKTLVSSLKSDYCRRFRARTCGVDLAGNKCYLLFHDRKDVQFFTIPKS